MLRVVPAVASHLTCSLYSRPMIPSRGANVTSTIVSAGLDGTFEAAPVVEHTNSTIFEREWVTYGFLVRVDLR
jgi:hypothetical protein